MNDGQRMKYVYVVALASMINRADLLLPLGAHREMIDTDEGISDENIVEVLGANVKALAASLAQTQIEKDRADVESVVGYVDWAEISGFMLPSMASVARSILTRRAEIARYQREQA